MAVSSTSVKGFKPYRSLYGVDMPNSLNFLLENSVTLTIGDAVRLDTNGAIKRCAAADPAVLGILTALYDQNGQVGVFASSRIPGTAIAGATLTPDDTIVTASDNRTSGAKQLKGAVTMDPSGMILYQNVTNGALAQANVGQFFNVASGNSGQIDQASASNTAGQFQLVALDPDGDGDTTKGLFRVAQNQFSNEITSYGSSAVITA